MKLYDNIKKLRISKNLSQDQLAKMVGYTDRSSIAKVEAGVVDLTQSKIQAFAEALGTTPTVLMGLDDSDDDARMYTSASINFIRIPLYAPLCCGDGLFVDDQIEGMIAVPSDGLSLPPDHYFAQRAKGTSMKDAGIADGDILVFEKTSVPESGMIGCFCIDENEAVCKKYKESSGIITLQAMNSDYEPIIINPENEHFSCIGKLKKVIKSFE